MGDESSPLLVKRSPVLVSSIVLPEKIHLLVADLYRELHCLLGFFEIHGLARPARGFPRISIGVQKHDLAQLGLARPEHVALVGPFPDGLFLFRRPLQPFSSAPASRCAVPRPRRRPSASRILCAPWPGSWARTPCAPGAARPGSWWFPRAARGSSRPVP